MIGDDSKKCPTCRASDIKKNGQSRGRQRYQCRPCKSTFYRYKKSLDIGKLYHQYSYGRQTLEQLSETYEVSVRSLQQKFDEHAPLNGLIKPITKPVHIYLDATFFGHTFGVLVFRANGKNVYWEIIKTESKEAVECALETLDSICIGGYTGFSIDGKPGIRELLKQRYNLPVYMCLFHLQQIIRRYTTLRPKTDCGQQIRRFSYSLRSRHHFSAEVALKVLIVIHKSFLLERNENNQFMHRRLRSAIRSLKNNLPFLCLKPRCIIRTTNSCEGSFSHWKAKVKIHRKLRIDRKIKMINYLLAHDSISIS